MTLLEPTWHRASEATIANRDDWSEMADLRRWSDGISLLEWWLGPVVTGATASPFLIGAIRL